MTTAQMNQEIKKSRYLGYQSLRNPQSPLLMTAPELPARKVFAGIIDRLTLAR